MIQLKIVLVLSALGLTLLACSHDRPANDASNANGVDNTGASAPSGNNTPSDDSMGTALPPDPSSSTGSGSTGTSPSGSGSGATGSGTNGH